jgi:hypothetical protein
MIYSRSIQPASSIPLPSSWMSGDCLHEPAKDRQVARGDDASVGDGSVKFLGGLEQGVERCGVGAKGGVRAGWFAWLHTQLSSLGPDGPHAVAEFETAGGRGCAGIRPGGASQEE